MVDQQIFSTEVENKAIDVKSILDQIKAGIIQKGYIREMLSFEDVRAKNEMHPCASQPYDNLQMLVDNRAMNELYHPLLERPLQNGRKLMRRPIMFIQRIVRKCVRFYIMPYVMDQEAFNAATTRFANQVSSYLIEGEQSEKSIQVIEEKLIKLVNRDLPRLYRDMAEVKKGSNAINIELDRVRQINDQLTRDNQLFRAKIELLEIKLEKEIYSRQPEDNT